MTQRYILLCGLALSTLMGSTVNAGWHEFQQRAHLDWHRNNVWPQPWTRTDRLATCRIFDLMAQNGWCQQSTLTDFHFDKATQQLTEAGRLKVAQVMTQHPQPFRTMFVVMANSERETAVRLDSVQQTAALVATDGVLPQIHRVAIPPRGWSADEINAIGKKRQETIPTPRLPDNIQSTTGG